jgi:hypothetical protein
MKRLRNIGWLRLVIIGMVVSVSSLLSSTVSLGDNTPTYTNINEIATDCRLSPDPDECYQKQSSGQWQEFDPASFLSSGILNSLNSKTLGLEGPLSFDLKYDTDLSWIFGLNYIHMFNESVGLASRLTGGPNEFRGNITAGYAFSKEHQLKLTYEYLTQNLPFDFASGSIDEWVAQHSIGATYQYVLRHEIVHSLELSGYVTRAGSKDLSTVTYNQQMVSANDFAYDVNYRRIAGGNEDTLMASLNLFPFADKKTALTVGAGYSQVSYDTQYENNSDYNSNKGAAYKVELTRLLSPTAKLETSVNSTASSREHKIQLSHILPKKLEGTVTAQYTVGQAGLPDESSVLFGLRFPAPDSYALGGFSDMQGFATWLEKPVMYYNRVLAIKDELVKSYEFKSNGTIPDQTKLFGQQLDQVPTDPYFQFSDPSIQVTYTVFTEKLSLNGAAKTKANQAQDYTDDLNLTLVPTTANEAVLKSASSAGFPSEDSTGQSTAGVYQITITGTGVTSGASPMVINSSFKLTLNGNGPSWDSTSIADANMGYVYPKEGEVDVTAKVTLTDPDTSATITFADDVGCIHPAWLTLVSCPSNPSNQCLSSGSTVVPDATNDATFCVRLQATGNESGPNLASYQTYTPNIIQVLPKWLTPQTPTIQYDDTTTKIDLGDSSSSNYIADGTRLGLTFQKGAGFDEEHWTFDPSDNSLHLKIADPSYYGLKQIPMDAANSTSYESVSNDVLVDVGNPNLDTTWTTNVPPTPLVAGVYKYNLNTGASPPDTNTALLLTSDGTTNVSDAYFFQKESGTADWNVVSEGDTYYLEYKDGNTAIPTSLLGTTVSVTLSAVSQTSGKNPSNGDANHYNTYTFKIGANPNLNVTWNNSNQPRQPIVANTYQYDLNVDAKTTPQGSEALINTADGSGSTYGDTYAPLT